MAQIPIEKIIRLQNIPSGALVRFDLQYTVTIEELEIVVKRLDVLPKYEDKLVYFFFKDGELSITLAATGVDGEKEINIYPKTEEELRTYNLLVKKLLIERNGKGAAFFITAEEYRVNLENRIKIDPAQAKLILEQELQKIEQEYSEKKETQNQEYFDFGDRPEGYVSKGEGKLIRSKIFNYLLVNRVIDFNGQFINWWHHIEILKVEEHIKYYKFIKAQLEKVQSPQPLLHNITAHGFSIEREDTVSSSRELVEEFFRCFSGVKKGSGKIMSSKDYERLIAYIIELIELRRVPDNIIPIPPVALSNEFIRKTFQLLHHKLYGKKRQHYWIDFIHKVFIQFHLSETTTTEKRFTSYNNNYEEDKRQIHL